MDVLGIEQTDKYGQTLSGDGHPHSSVNRQVVWQCRACANDRAPLFCEKHVKTHRVEARTHLHTHMRALTHTCTCRSVCKGCVRALQYNYLVSLVEWSRERPAVVEIRGTVAVQIGFLEPSTPFESIGRFRIIQEDMVLERKN